MNCPPATRRLVIATLHQVQRRSGNSAVDAVLPDGDANVSAMVGILAKASRVCQCTRLGEISEINIYTVSNLQYIACICSPTPLIPNRKVVSHMHNAEGVSSDDISSSSARVADSAVHPDSVGPGKAWGICTSVDLHDCIPDRIRDAKQIEAYVVQLCDLIEMKRYGACQVVNFGEGRVAGYSMVQLIETSLISGHFANDTNSAYLDIFSCKGYDPAVVEEFSKAFFGARRSSHRAMLRY